MTQPIETAYVLIRPQLDAGFQQQAARQLQGSLSTVQRRTSRVGSAARDAEKDVARFNRGIVAANASALGFGRALTFASTAFIGGAGLGAVIRTGVDEFASMTRVAATTNSILKATGQSAGIGAAGISRQATALEHLSGVDDELIKQSENVLLSFRRVRNEVGSGNDIFNRATRAALDLSSVFGGDVASSARFLGRALADPARGVTQLRRANVAFTADQIKLIKSLVETGQTLRAQKLILDQVEGSVGGTAAAIGRTLPGRLNILRERAKDALGEYVKRLSESKDAADLAAGGAKGLGQAFAVVEGTARAIGPPLVSAAKAAGQISSAVGGVGPILAAVAAYKAVGIAVGVSRAAQAAYARATTIATGATVAQTEAEVASAAALGVSSASRVAASTATVAEVGTAGRAAAVGLGAARVGLAALGGPLGVAAIGAAGLTLAFLKMRRGAADSAGGINATRRSLNDLSAALQHAATLQQNLAGRSENVSVARFDVQAAANGLARARVAAAASRAQTGSLEQRALAQQVTEAEQRLTDAEKNLAAAISARDTVQQRLTANERSRQFVIGNTVKGLNAQIEAQRALLRARFSGLPDSTRKTQVIAQQLLPQVTDLLDKLAASGDQVDQRVGGALSTVVSVLNRIPTRKEIELVVKLAGQGKDVNAIVAGLGLAQDSGVEQKRLQGAVNVTINAQLDQQFAAAKALLKAEREKLKTVRETAQARRDDLTAARDSLQAARDAVTSAREAAQATREGLASAREALVASQRSLADTIQQTRAATNASVRDAKSNLDQLGQSIADAFGRFQEKSGASLGRGGALGAQFRQLRDQIVAGRGGPETQRAAQTIATRLAAQPPPAASDLPQRFADLTDNLNRGKISAREFNRELTRLLKGLDLGAFRRDFGSASTAQLREQIAAARRQAQLVAGGPQRAGGGFQATIIRPLQTVAQGARDVAGAQKDVAAAQRDVAKAQADIVRSNREVAAAQRRLGEAQTKETRANTAAVKANTAELREARKVRAAQDRKDKAKPKGAAAAETGALTTAGATTP